MHPALIIEQWEMLCARRARYVQVFFFLWGPHWQMSTIPLALRKMVCWTFQKMRTFHLNVKRCYWSAGHLYWNYSVADSVFISSRFWGKTEQTSSPSGHLGRSSPSYRFMASARGLRSNWSGWFNPDCFHMLCISTWENFPNELGHSFVIHTNVATVVYK